MIDSGIYETYENENKNKNDKEKGDRRKKKKNEFYALSQWNQLIRKQFTKIREHSEENVSSSKENSKKNRANSNKKQIFENLKKNKNKNLGYCLLEDRKSVV